MEPVLIRAALSGCIAPVNMHQQEAPETPQLQQRPKLGSKPEVKGKHTVNWQWNYLLKFSGQLGAAEISCETSIDIKSPFKLLC